MPVTHALAGKEAFPPLPGIVRGRLPQQEHTTPFPPAEECSERLQGLTPQLPLGAERLPRSLRPIPTNNKSYRHQPLQPVPSLRPWHSHFEETGKLPPKIKEDGWSR